MRLGFARARGTVVAIQDADLELDPAQLAGLVAPILRGETRRRLRIAVPGGRPDAPALTIAANRSLTWLTNVLYGSSLTDMETCYKIMRARRRAQPRRSRPIGSTSSRRSPRRLLLAGHRIVERPVRFTPRSRAAGKKIGWRDGVIAIRVLVRLRFSRRTHRMHDRDRVGRDRRRGRRSPRCCCDRRRWSSGWSGAPTSPVDPIRYLSTSIRPSCSSRDASAIRSRSSATRRGRTASNTAVPVGTRRRAARRDRRGADVSARLLRGARGREDSWAAGPRCSGSCRSSARSRVWCTFLLGRRLAGAHTGRAWPRCASGASPAFLYQVVQPMSDVPAAARGRRRSSRRSAGQDQRRRFAAGRSAARRCSSGPISRRSGS